ncbi:MAG TPA: Ku protein [Selenomonadales bacterium]|nr:Ku protein [Selenomonadales bacterium]
MQRPIWSGAISFGLVNIPIRLYNSVRKKTVSFHQLRKKDGCRIRLKRVCASDGTEVAGEDIVKGYEVSPERYVVISPAELQALYPKATRLVEIEQFAERDQLDPIFFEHSYFAVPDQGAAKSYSLLLSALRESGKIAIAKFILRNKEYLAALRPAGKLLGLSTLYFADEVVPQTELEGLPDTAAEPAERELTMAEQLIESLSADFEPAQYRNEYYDRVMSLIERKAAGEKILAQPETQPGARVIDLTAALEASLAAVRKKAPAKEGRKKTRAH